MSCDIEKRKQRYITALQIGIGIEQAIDDLTPRYARVNRSTANMVRYINYLTDITNQHLFLTDDPLYAVCVNMRLVRWYIKRKWTP